MMLKIEHQAIEGEKTFRSFVNLLKHIAPGNQQAQFMNAKWTGIGDTNSLVKDSNGNMTSVPDFIEVSSMNSAMESMIRIGTAIHVEFDGTETVHQNSSGNRYVRYQVAQVTRKGDGNLYARARPKRQGV